MEEVAQRGCRVSSLRGIQSLTGQCRGLDWVTPSNPTYTVILRTQQGRGRGMQKTSRGPATQHEQLNCKGIVQLW